MAEVQFINASRVYPGGSIPAVNDLTLEIADGEFMVVVGPSGSGKSTALRMLAGLEDVDQGEIHIGGNDVSTKPPKDRDIAMVFQNYALYPHMSVAENMGFALKLKHVPKQERDQKVREAAKMLDLEAYLDRKPKALSGGQRQRVAMGRAIVREPSVFLMDEPLSNLDAKLRVETRANIATLQARLGTTTVYVTHDQVEAMTLGHRVALLKDGVLQQVDTPGSLYDKPRNAFVAGFMGSPAMNLRDVDLNGGGARLGGALIPLSQAVLDAAAAADLKKITLGIRPESMHVAPEGASNVLRLHVNLIEELGADAYVHGTLPEENELNTKQFVVRFDGRVERAVRGVPDPHIGDTIAVEIRTSDEHAFNPETGERLG